MVSKTDGRRHTGEATGKQKYRMMDEWTDIKTDGYIRQTCRLAQQKKTQIQMGRQADRQKDGETDRQTD